MAGNKVDVEIDSLSTLKCVKTGFIVLVLVPSADIDVAVVISVGRSGSDLNGPGKICSESVSFLPDTSSREINQYLCLRLRIPQHHTSRQITSLADDFCQALSGR